MSSSSTQQTSESNTQYNVGDFVRDTHRDEDDLLIVSSIIDESAGDVVASYDYKANPVTVAEMNKKDGFSCDSDTGVVGVVYDSAVQSKYDGNVALLSNSELQKVVEELNVKEYYFPVSRIEAVS